MCILDLCLESIVNRCYMVIFYYISISKPTKRVKTDASIPTPGAGASAAPTPALPSTGGPSTPASGAPSPGAFNRVSLPGQQKAAVTPTPGAASAAPAGVSTGAGSSAAKSSAAAAAANEKTNYDNITDVMGYVGVDLKEETDNIMRDNDGYSKSGSGADGQDRTRVQNFVNATQLKAKIERIGKTKASYLSYAQRKICTSNLPCTDYFILFYLLF